ncbi:MAG: hypothetical protein WA584_09365 [Pyrinomonadaceae bacterium]
MKFRILVAVFVIVVVALIAFSKINRKPFAPAEDFPREALVYVQISDLPAFIRLWNESKLKEKYTTSENFRDFTNGHLGLKLASRWQEFNEASGFPFDLETLGGLTENQAAVALYDIGKLEFVFIAPMRDELFAATKFVQNQSNFAEETLEDGTVLYRANVEADRGRQRQELIFTNAKGRFVLATSEKLLAETLGNINGNKSKNRLSDEPAFKILSEKTEPHTATVWINQTVLNEDYCFKRYWLMSDVENLKNIRAGIFDFEMREEKLVERRRFLLNQAVASSPVAAAQAAEMLAFLPENIPFYRLQSASPKTIDEAIENTIFARRKPEARREDGNRFYYSSFEAYEDDSYRNYRSPGEEFDESIDEADEDETIERRETDLDFSKLIQAANPKAILTFTEPQVLPAPMFIEFRRGAIFQLASPANFNRELFESETEKRLLAQILISAPDARLNWETKTGKDASWRELKLPMLEWKIAYTVRGSELILTDNADFLLEIVAAGNSQAVKKQNSPLDALTVLNLDQRENAYDQIFAGLAGKKAANEFFTGNIKSLLDSVSDVKKIEIRERYLQNILDEEIIADYK